MAEAKPKVSVVMITYNQEKFIEQAVNSVLMQETNFDYEIIIGEDCSTDRTREILIELQKQHPDKIRLVLNPQNLGIIPNFINVMSMARGEYVAFLEGDDYWTHPRKLQIQVDYMEAHPECLLCFHAFEIIWDQRPDLPAQVIKPLPNVPNKDDGFHSMHFGTFLYRRNNPLPMWFHDLRASGEWPLITWVLMQGGKIGFVDGEPMSVYRKHPEGVSTACPNVQRGLDKLHDYRVVTAQLTPYQRKHIFYSPLSRIHLYLCRAYLSEGDLPKARHHLIRYIYHGRSHFRREVSKVAKLALQCYLPRFYSMLMKMKKKSTKTTRGF